jgi:hypothetical protein
MDHKKKSKEEAGLKIKKKSSNGNLKETTTKINLLKKISDIIS